MAAFMLPLIALIAFPAWSSGELVYRWPTPGSEWQSSETVVIFGFDGPVPTGVSAALRGSSSGSLAFSEHLSPDGRRLVLIPDQPFLPGETVEVSASIRGSERATWSFTVRPVEPVPPPADRCDEPPVHQGSIPSQAPSSSVWLPADFPAFTFNVYGATGEGNVFFSPLNLMGSNSSTYLIMADNTGDVLFYRHGLAGFFNVEVQQNGLLTFINGGSYADSPGWVEIDDTYTVVDSFTVTGYPTDNHDYTIAENGNRLLIGVDYRYIDMSQVVPGGNPDALVAGLLIQEQDPDHVPVFQWSSFDHFEITDACDYVDLTGATVDYVHCNSIDEDEDGGILVSCLAMTECTKIDRQTGELVWRFGGCFSDNPDFTILNDPLDGFSSQHDFRSVGGGLYSVFDNGTHHSPKVSRGLVYELNTQSMTADLVWSYQANGLYGSHMGSMQVLPGGNAFIGWGDVTGVQVRPDFSEVTPGGDLVFRGRISQRLLESYRAYRFDWEGQALVPYLVALVLPAQNCVQLTYNVFGNQEFSSYDIYHGTSPLDLNFLQNTTMNQINLWQLPTGMNYFAVKARDMQGIPTGFSNVDSAMVTWTGTAENTAAPLTAPGEIGIRPNPASASATVFWPENWPGEASIEIRDLCGRTVFSTSREGVNSAVLGLQALPPGIYAVSVVSGDQRRVEKLAILR